MPPAVKLRKGKRQRFYARNSLNTTLPWWVKRSMPSFPAGNAANSLYRDHIHPTLTTIADEVCATVARLFAYVGTLALLVILGIHGWDQLQAFGIDTPAYKAGWTVADWVVANASTYGITQVSYDGWQWTASLTETSWQPAASASASDIVAS